MFFSFKSRLLVFLAQKKYPQTTIERKSDNEPSLAITEFYLNPRAIRKIPFCLSRVWLLRFPAFLSCRKLHFSMFSSIYNAYRKKPPSKKNTSDSIYSLVRYIYVRFCDKTKKIFFDGPAESRSGPLLHGQG